MMTIHMDEMVRALTKGLDAVESDFLGASTNHGPRIATLCIAMGRKMGLADAELTTLASCAMLHDNALTEYILSERPGSAQNFNMVSHCLLGERNAAVLPFEADPTGLILYHHERCDGTGPFGKKTGQIPEGAELIAIADAVDSRMHLQRCSAADLPGIQEYVTQRTGTAFAPHAAQLFLQVLDEALLKSLRDEYILLTIARHMPQWKTDLSEKDLMHLAAFVARIIDYKSQFTKTHSVQVANMAWQMARRYGYAEDKRARLYLAAALHDIGKLFVPTELLEKPGALSDSEFVTVKSHAVWTGELLGKVEGLGEIATWAANHHEKLDGQGYPQKKTADQLDEVSRLLAILDIYQAVSDSRPYHPARSHHDTMEILDDLAQKGQLDARIVADVADVMQGFENGMVPGPAGGV